MLIEIKNFIIHIAPYLPFISAAVVSRQQLNLSSLVSRLLESAIIAAVILYANVQVMDTKVRHIERSILDIRSKDTKIEQHIEIQRDKLNSILIKLEGLRKDIQYQNRQSEN